MPSFSTTILQRPFNTLTLYLLLYICLYCICIFLSFCCKNMYTRSPYPEANKKPTYLCKEMVNIYLREEWCFANSPKLIAVTIPATSLTWETLEVSHIGTVLNVHLNSSAGKILTTRKVQKCCHKHTAKS